MGVTGPGAGAGGGAEALGVNTNACLSKYDKVSPLLKGGMTAVA